MLSVLIPVFNFDITTFVADLQKQCMGCNIDFEIRCYDDGSEEKYRITNRSVQNLEGVILKELPKNIGRSKIRNLLAAEAKFEKLLFLDCDSKVVSDMFIDKYIESAESNNVVCGGTSYESKAPSDKSMYLKWLYGSSREVIPVSIRQGNPYQAFKTYNFLISRNVFLPIKFNEEIIEYGHEDTLFGFMLHERNVPVTHIDNPLCHIGLETPLEFLDKTEKGLQNLHYILEKKLPVEDIKILRYYKRIRNLGLCFFVEFLFKRFRKSILNNLLSNNPSLILYDFYKLGYFIFFRRSKYGIR